MNYIISGLVGAFALFALATFWTVVTTRRPRMGDKCREPLMIGGARSGHDCERALGHFGAHAAHDGGSDVWWQKRETS